MTEAPVDRAPEMAAEVAAAVLVDPAIARVGTPLPRLADELGGLVREVLGPVPVEVTFADVVSVPAPARPGTERPDP